MEQIIGKKDADSIFALTKSGWEKDSKGFFAAGRVMISTAHETGIQVAAYDPSTGVGHSIQPIFENENDTPMMVIVGSYFPVSILPAITGELLRDMETATQNDLGPSYNVRLAHNTTQQMEMIDMLVTRS